MEIGVGKHTPQAMVDPQHFKVEFYSEAPKNHRVHTDQIKLAIGEANKPENRQIALLEMPSTLPCDHIDSVPLMEYDVDSLVIGDKKTSKVRIKFVRSDDSIKLVGFRDSHNREKIRKKLYQIYYRNNNWDKAQIKKDSVDIEHANLTTFDIDKVPLAQRYVFYAFLKELLKSHKKGCCVLSALPKISDRASVADQEKKRIVAGPLYQGASTLASSLSFKRTDLVHGDHTKRDGPSEEKSGEAAVSGLSRNMQISQAHFYNANISQVNQDIKGIKASGGSTVLAGIPVNQAPAIQKDHTTNAPPAPSTGYNVTSQGRGTTAEKASENRQMSGPSHAGIGPINMAGRNQYSNLGSGSVYAAETMTFNYSNADDNAKVQTTAAATVRKNAPPAIRPSLTNQPRTTSAPVASSGSTAKNAPPAGQPSLTNEAPSADDYCEALRANPAYSRVSNAGIKLIAPSNDPLRLRNQQTREIAREAEDAVVNLLLAENDIRAIHHIFQGAPSGDALLRRQFGRLIQERYQEIGESGPSEISASPSAASKTTQQSRRDDALRPSASTSTSAPSTSQPSLTTPARRTDTKQSGQSTAPASSSTRIYYSKEKDKFYVTIGGKQKWVNNLTDKERASLGRLYVKVNNEEKSVEDLTAKERTSLGIKQGTSVSPSTSEAVKKNPQTSQQMLNLTKPAASSLPASPSALPKTTQWKWWEVTKREHASSLLSLGMREAGTEGLKEAVAACRAALKENHRSRVPLEWASTQTTLGIALCTLGKREAGTKHLEEAVEAFRGALEEQTPARKRIPLAWATTQSSLGVALLSLGEREAGTERLKEAVATCQSALEDQTRVRAREPLNWARMQSNLAGALLSLGEREAGTERLEEAVAACRAALKENHRTHVPLEWARTQTTLGVALLSLGEREAGTKRLEEAVEAFRGALKEQTPARKCIPLEWALTQSNLGYALCTLGKREAGTTRLEEAVAAYRSALQERTRASVPLEWERTQGNLDETLRLLKERRHES